jgi:hypothetical protein
MKLGPLEISWTQRGNAIMASTAKMTDGANPKSQIENPKSAVGLPGTPIFSGFLSTSANTTRSSKV